MMKSIKISVLSSLGLVVALMLGSAPTSQAKEKTMGYKGCCIARGTPHGHNSSCSGRSSDEISDFAQICIDACEGEGQDELGKDLSDKPTCKELIQKAIKASDSCCPNNEA